MGNTYSAYRQNLHVTFQDELQDIEKGFHDNVKSAECTCDLGNFCILVSTVPSTFYTFNFIKQGLIKFHYSLFRSTQRPSNSKSYELYQAVC